MNVKATGFIHQIQTLDKSSPVAVYCRSGTQSIQAAKILRDNGFEIIYVLKGGLNQWIKDGKEIVK
jgi:rhodanese-related sulfurtransferase